MAEGQTTTGDGNTAGETVVAPVSAPNGGAARGRTTRELLSHWKTEAETRAIAQQLAAVSEATTNRVLGISVTVLAAIGGTSAFASLLASSNQTVGLAAGVFTVIATRVVGGPDIARARGEFGRASGGFRGLLWLEGTS